MSFKPKVKKAQRKARARRAAKNRMLTVVTPKPEKPHVYPQHENAQLHATSAHIANEARALERLMERKRWSNA
jgi:hypothetical protein